MERRHELHTKLVEILGSPHVYFQPPSTIRMKYPCIVYNRDGFSEKFSNDHLYFNKTRYSITVIDSNPDSPIPSKVAQLPLTSFSTNFVSDNLNHDVYSTYY